MGWTKVPDILAIASLACAFASISKQSRTAAHRLWLVGWSMIVVHFIAYMIVGEPGIVGMLAGILGLTTLVAAGMCFMWATVPSETGINSRRMAVVAFLTTSLYLVLACLPSAPSWAFDLAAVLVGLGPLTVGIVYRKNSQHGLRWLTVGLQLALGGALLVLRRQSGAPDLGVDAILFVVYLGCSVYFWYSHRSGTTGSVITIGGFLAWASVFVIAPLMGHFLPNFHVENEVWNLPKYVVAIGQLLLLLEKQIERSQYLALHDDLTALANRRLFQDRLSSAFDRARRSGTSVALLQIDLDGFKAVNDTFGHHLGDQLLQHVAAILQSRVRRSDTVARTGGDEFSVIMEESNGRAAATAIAEALIRTLSQPVLIDGKQIRIGASIGIALFPDDAQSAEALCIEADLRMYAVKQIRRDDDRDMRENTQSFSESQSIAR